MYNLSSLSVTQRIGFKVQTHILDKYAQERHSK